MMPHGPWAGLPIATSLRPVRTKYNASHILQAFQLVSIIPFKKLETGVGRKYSIHRRSSLRQREDSVAAGDHLRSIGQLPKGQLQRMSHGLRYPPAFDHALSAQE